MGTTGGYEDSVASILPNGEGLNVVQRLELREHGFSKIYGL